MDVKEKRERLAKENEEKQRKNAHGKGKNLISKHGTDRWTDKGINGCKRKRKKD